MSDNIHILPFERLLGMLRAHGFYTGVDTLMRLSKYWDVLSKRSDWDLQKVKYQLAALLCKSADDQAKLYEILDTYLPESLLKVNEVAPPPLVPLTSLKPSKPISERPPADPAPAYIPPTQFIPAGVTGPILPVLDFPEEPMRPWNLPGMGPALIPLQEKVWTETAEWDVPATILRTIHAGGIPQFCFKKRKRAPRYLALIEQLNPRDHLAGFSAELMREINRRDLEAEFYFYEKTPARCWKNLRNLRSHVHLDLLKSEWEGARLLLIGSTTPFINPATGQPSNLAFDLPDSWEEVALLNTASPLEWGAAEQTLMELFPVVPLTMHGLASLMNQWNATEFRLPAFWQTEDPQAIPPSLTPDRDRTRDDVVLDMYRYLGKDAFRWASATAVYPEIYYEMTAILHDEAIPPNMDLSEWEQNHVWHSALLLLCRLEWYRRGYIPEPMRDNLRQRLSNTDLGTVEQEIRRILEWSENTVLAGSFAEDERQEMFGWLADRLFRVLWIDDHPENNARFQAAWTKEMGVVFKNATNMGEALTYLAEPFDLIISDIGRKGESNPGFTTLQELRSRSIQTPVAFFTNTRGMNLRDSLKDDGALEVTNMVSVLKKLLEERIRLKFAPPEQAYSQTGSGSSSFGEPEQTSNFEKESANEEYSRYQTILKELGYLKGQIDGKFGPETRKALQAFQKERGLIADGIIGKQTKAALEKAQSDLQTQRETPEIPQFWRESAAGVCSIRLSNGTFANGFLAEDGYIYSAQFVLPDAEAVRSATVTFTADSGVWSYSFGLDENDFQTGGPSELGFSRAKPKEDLNENYPMLRRFSFRLESPGTGAKVSLVYQLPNRTSPVYRLDCPVNRFSEKDITYEAETEPGASGSPVFMPDGRVVGMHISRSLDGVNTGVLMKEVMAVINAPQSQSRFDQWRNMIAEGELRQVLAEMAKEVNSKDISNLYSRYRQLENDYRIRGVIPFDEFQSILNEIIRSTLEIIDKLEKGHRLMYRIPTKWEIGKEEKCLVRIAWNEMALTENYEADPNDVLQDIRVSEVMSVEIKDPSSSQVYEIRTVSEPVQFVDKDIYTEWVFYVKKVATEDFPLTLKVSNIEVVDGKERKKDSVFEIEPEKNDTNERADEPEKTTKTIFISYAYPDEKRFWDFQKHLERLKSRYHLEIETRRDMEMMKSPPAMRSFMERADLILLLVSPAYLSSDEILKEEMYSALEMQETGGKTVVPVIIQPCEWQSGPLAYFQAIPSGGRPVSDFSREERGWSEVVDELEGIIQRLGKDDDDEVQYSTKGPVYA